MFKILKDYNGNGILLKAGEYSKEDLIKLYKTEDRFNFCFTCTSLKQVLIPIVENKNLVDKVKEKVEEVISIVANQELDLAEEKVEEVQIIYIANEDIKKGRKVVVKKDEKISYDNLVDIFGDKLDNAVFDLLTETKILKDVSI